MKVELQNHFSWLANKLAECVSYDWNSETIQRSVEESFDTFYKSLKKDSNQHLVDIKSLTIEQAKEMRFSRWCSDDVDEEIADLKSSEEYKADPDKYKDKIEQLNDTKNLFLIPLWFVPLLPQGIELTCIDGSKIIFNKKDDIDLDTRCGCIAYGIHFNSGDNNA
jgi:hypothetical protein